MTINAFTPNSFYEAQVNDPNNRAELANPERAQTVYEYRERMSLWQAIKHTLWSFTGIFHIHKYIGKQAMFQPAINASRDKDELAKKRVSLMTPDRIVKRVTVNVNGVPIDAVLIGTKETMKSKRWMSIALGNNVPYEKFCTDERSAQTVQRLQDKLATNVLVFNYAGIGTSSGAPTRATLNRTYRAMMQFLEDEEHGLGAREVIEYQYSMGGVMNEAVENCPFQAKHVVINPSCAGLPRRFANS